MKLAVKGLFTHRPFLHMYIQKSDPYDGKKKVFSQIIFDLWLFFIYNFFEIVILPFLVNLHVKIHPL